MLFRMLALTLLALAALGSAGCGDCGSTQETVPIPDGGVPAPDGGALPLATCQRLCEPSSEGYPLASCRLDSSEIVCEYTNHVTCLKTGKTD
jgi:hypothetical protein